MKKITYLILFIILLVPVTALHDNWAGNVPTYISRYLTDNGLTNGTKNAIADYSSGTIFYIQPPTDKVYRISRIMITIADVAITDADEYGSIAALTNGVTFWHEENGARSMMTDNLSIKNNGQYVKLMHDFNCDMASIANGLDYCTGRWTFDKSGTVLRLDGNTSDKLIVMFNDSMIGLDEHYFLVQGYEELNTNTTEEILTDIKEADNMLGIAILIIGFIFSILYSAKTIQGKTEQGDVVQFNMILKACLYAVAGLVIFLSIQLALSFSDTIGLSTQIQRNLEIIYQFNIWIAILLFAVFMIAFIVWIFTWLMKMSDQAYNARKTRK